MLSRSARRSGTSIFGLATLGVLVGLLIGSAAIGGRDAPAKPQGVKVVAAQQTSVELNWSSRGQGIAAFVLYRDGAEVGSSLVTSAPVSGLSCGTVYRLGVAAVSEDGVRSKLREVRAVTSACGSTESTPPTAPSGLAQASSTETAVRLTWGPSQDDDRVLGYDVHRDGVFAGRTSTTEFMLSGLACGGSYAVSVAAYDPAGNRSPSAESQVRTAPCPDTSPPSAPRLLSLVESTATSVSLSWDPSRDDVGVAGYDVFADRAKVDTVTAPSTVVSGLTCGSSYTFGVEAFDAAGNRSPRTTLAASTSACAPPEPTEPPQPPPTEPAPSPPAPPPADTTPPSAPKNQRLSDVTQTSFRMTWDAATDNVGVTGYNVYLDGVKQATVTGLSYTYEGLACGTSYVVALEARDAAGNVSNRAQAQGPASTLACSSPDPEPKPSPPPADTTPPSAPKNQRLSDVTQTSFRMTWDAATDNVGVTGYNVYLDGVKQATVTGLSYTYEGLACGTSYVVALEARDAAGNVSNRAQAQGPASTLACSSPDPEPKPSPPPADTTPPSAPKNQRLSDVTQTSFRMTWDAATDNVGVTGYNVYLDGVKQATVTGLSYTYEGLACGTSYVVALEARDAAGNVSNRAEAQGPASTLACSSPDPEPKPSPPPADTTPPSAPIGLTVTGVAESSISVSWAPSVDDVAVAGYDVLVDGVKVTTVTVPTAVVALGCGKTYTIGVEAFDAAGNHSERSTLEASTSACAEPSPPADTTPPSAPKNQRLSDVTQTSFRMTWDAATDNVGVTGYNVYLDGVKQATVTGLSYTYEGLACGTSYVVALEARDAAGNVSNRAQAQGPASTLACSSPSPAPPSSDATLFVSTSGSDASPCTRTLPCASFQHAYTLAPAGAVVEVAGGTYPSQSLSPVAGKSAPDVVFREAAGARVILGGLSINGADYVTFSGMETTYKGTSPGAGNQRGIWVGPGSTYITLENMDAGSVSSWFADHLTVRGGDYGPCDAVTGSNVCGNNKQDVGQNILIENAYFHDLEYDASAPGAHWECMYINGGKNVTIRGNRFERCAIFDLFATISGPDAGAIGHENLTIEGNDFEPATNGYGVESRGWSSLSLAWCQNASQPAYRNVLIKGNDFNAGKAGIEVDLNADRVGCRWQNVRVEDNRGLMWQGRCQNNWSYARNEWVGGGSCG